MVVIAEGGGEAMVTDKVADGVYSEEETVGR